MLFPEGKIIIFSKAPIIGQSKTRLIPVLGAQGACELHRRMSSATIKMAWQARLAAIELYCTPNVDHRFFQQIQKRYAIKLAKQQGTDLGARLSNAFERALHDYRYAIIIGTDSPGLDANYIKTAFEKLQEGFDVVLGPALDGGYVLIGMSNFNAALFTGIDWGTANVYSQSVSRCHSAGLTLFEMNGLWDVDRPEDLHRIQHCTEHTWLLDHL